MNTRTIDDLPEISFIEDITYEEILDRMKNSFLEKKQGLTGKEENLLPTDDNNIILNTVALVFYQLYRVIDNGLKKNLLKYAINSDLEYLGILKNCEKIKSEKARCKVEFTLSETQEEDYIVDAGTELVKDDIVFVTVEDCIIKSNQLKASVLAICKNDGETANGILVGELKTLINPLPYVESVRNIEISYGGKNEESDYDYANRILNSIYGKSTGGSEPSYEYFIRKADNEIQDVHIKTLVDEKGNPKGELEITLLYPKSLESGFDDRVIRIRKYLNDNGIRVSTDKLTFKKAKRVEVKYNIYYCIHNKYSPNSEKIKSEINEKVSEYQNKLTSKLGGFYNCNELVLILLKNDCKDIGTGGNHSDNYNLFWQKRLAPDEVFVFDECVMEFKGLTDSESNGINLIGG